MATLYANDERRTYPAAQVETLICVMNEACLKCGSALEPKPVLGAVLFPQRLVCPVHGYLSPDPPPFSPEDEDASLSEEAVLQFQEREKIRAVNQGQGLRKSSSRSLTKSAATHGDVSWAKS
jgi:hypothetical protein